MEDGVDICWCRWSSHFLEKRGLEGCWGCWFFHHATRFCLEERTFGFVFGLGMENWTLVGVVFGGEGGFSGGEGRFWCGDTHLPPK